MIKKCVRCKRVERIYAKGLCIECYSRKARHKMSLKEKALLKCDDCGKPAVEFYRSLLLVFSKCSKHKMYNISKISRRQYLNEL